MRTWTEKHRKIVVLGNAIRVVGGLLLVGFCLGKILPNDWLWLFVGITVLGLLLSGEGKP